MNSSAVNQICCEAFSRRNGRTWLRSGLAAVGMNLFLFLLMVHLMDPVPTRSSLETLIPQVHVIRISRPEMPVKRPTAKAPPEPKPVEKSGTTPRQPTMAKPTLPFKINPRLPAGPKTLALPALKSAPLITSTDLPGAFEPGQLDGPLTVLVRMPPLYPMSARNRGIEGWVKVRLIVDETGHVDGIEIIAAEPPKIFEESVRSCVAGWRFRPGTVEGVSVRAKVETTIRFTLE